MEPYCDRDSRQKHYNSKFGFTCSCTCCSLESEESSASDTRRTRIGELDDIIYNHIRNGKYEEGLAGVAERLELLAVEGLDTPAMICRVAYDAYQACQHSDDSEGAKKWIKMVYEHQKLSDHCESDDLVELGKVIASL